MVFALALMFFASQVSGVTANSDVWVYALRSLSTWPILDYAFLDHRSSPFSIPVNYHLGHSALLWFVYSITPESLSESIRPAGYLSSACLALTVMLGFLVWRHVGIDRLTAMLASGLFAVVPVVWLNGVVGEVYSLQVALSLLFVYLFLKKRVVLSGVAFLASVLVSPLAGLGFAYMLLGRLDFRTMVHACYVGLVSLTLYFLLFHIVGNSPFDIFSAPNLAQVSRSFAFRVAKFIGILLLNFSVLLPFLIIGVQVASKSQRRIIVLLAIATLPHIALALSGGDFLNERGTFFLLLFWSAGLPIAIGVRWLFARSRLWASSLVVASMLFGFATTVFPDREQGRDYLQAGRWVEQNVDAGATLVGAWTGGVVASFARFGWDMEKLTTQLIHQHRPDADTLKVNGLTEAAILVRKPTNFRLWVASRSLLPVPYAAYTPESSIDTGTTRLAYENDSVMVYLWSR